MKKELPIGMRFAVPLLLLIVAFNIPVILRLFVDTENNSYLSTSVKLLLLTFFMFFLIPKVIGIPSRNDRHQNLEKIGLIKTNFNVQYLLLGILLGLISLTFMFLGSSITGEIAFDLSNLELNHVYFSLVPGIFEEVVFRGYLMVVAIMVFKSFRKAAIFQVVIFTLSHMKEFSAWGMVDTLTVGVIAVAFTYVVFKTGHLYTAIIFHFIHDAFIFVVQRGDGLNTFIEHFMFYLFVWIGMGIIILVTRFVCTRYLHHDQNLYLKTQIN